MPRPLVHLPPATAPAASDTCSDPCFGGLCFSTTEQIALWCVIGALCVAVYYANRWREQRKSRPKVRPAAKAAAKRGAGTLEDGLLNGASKGEDGPVRVATGKMQEFCDSQVSCGVTHGLEAASLAVLALVKHRFRYMGASLAIFSGGKLKAVDVEPTEKEMSFKDLVSVADEAIKAAGASAETADQPEVILSWNSNPHAVGQWSVKQDGDGHAVVQGSSPEEERSFKLAWEACAADPDANVWEVPIFAQWEIQRAATWGAPATNFAKQRDPSTCKLKPVPVLMKEKSYPPTALAVAGEGWSTSYQSFQARADAVTAAIKASAPTGSSYGKSVVLCMGRGEMISPAFMGILQAGYTVVPVDISWPGDRVNCVAQDSKAGLVLVDAASEAIWSALQVPGITPLLVGEALFKQYAEQQSAPEPIDQEDTAVILFTSGSTGRPKGILLSHGYLTALITGVADSKEITSQSKTLLYHSPTWMPFLDYLLCPLLNGGCCLLYPESAGHTIRPAELSKFAHQHEATCLGSVPAVLDILLENGLPKSMKQIGVGGALVPEELCHRAVAAVQGCIMTTGYSGTEQGDVTQAKILAPGDVDDFANGKGGMTAGRTHAGQRFVILDRGSQPLSIGAIGEVTVSGPGLASGYLALPQQTAEYFVPCAAMGGERSARTGDLGRWDTSGNIEIVGRLGSMVKVRGARVDLGEVETAVLSHPSVTACAVSVHDDKLVAYAVPAVPGDLRDFCKQKLVSYMVPHVFVGLDELPKLANGKINKKALKPPDPEEGGGETVMELDSLGQMRKFTRQNAAEDLVLDNVRAILIGVIIHGHNIPLTKGSLEMRDNGWKPLNENWGMGQYTFLYLLVSGGWSSLAFLSGFDDTRAEHKGYGLTYREVLFIAIWLLFDFNWTMWYFPAFVIMRVAICAAHKAGLELTHIALASQIWLIAPAFVDMYVGWTPYFKGDGHLNPPQDKVCPSECFCPFEAWPWFQSFTYYTVGYWNSGVENSWLGHGLIFIPCYWIGLYSGKYVFPLLTRLANEPSLLRRAVVTAVVLTMYYFCFTILDEVKAGYDDRCRMFWSDGELRVEQIFKNVRYFAMNLGMSLLYVVFIAAACPVHLKYLAKISFASLIFSPFFACVLDLAPMALAIRSTVPSFISPVLEVLAVLAVPFTYELVMGVAFTTAVGLIVPPIIKLVKRK